VSLQLAPEKVQSLGRANERLGRSANRALAPFGVRVMITTGKVIDHVPDRSDTVAALVELHGECGIATSEEIALLIKGLLDLDDLVVVDLEGVSSVDSTFLTLLVSAQRLANELGSALRLKLGPAGSHVQTEFERYELFDKLDCI
jgi:ABC-type transporter Mla MlaB component